MPSRWKLTLVVLVVLIVLGVGWWLIVPGVRKDSVKIEMLSSTVVLGEKPRVRIQVTAPWHRPLWIIKQGQAKVRGSFSFEVSGEDGSFVPCRLPSLWLDPLTLNDYDILVPGQTVVLEFDAWGKPIKPGEFLVHVRCDLDYEHNLVFEKELPFVCVDGRANPGDDPN